MTGVPPVTDDEVLAVDRAHVWHPYDSIPPATAPYLVESAEGTRLRLRTPAGAREVVDAMSSWWSVVHGYRHPALVAAVQAQAAELAHVMFGGLTHRPAVELCRRLVAMTPDPLQKVFLCDSGSVAVEVAGKMALQHWRSRGRPAKRRLLTWRGGYHGDTLLAMSVCDPEGGMHALWSDVLPCQVFVGPPPGTFADDPDPAYVAELQAAVAHHAAELAAVIVEPVVQGAGGMRFHSPGYLRVLRQLCDRHGVLLVFDEIATGFGRTGRRFAAEWAGVSPDILCVGKALTGGMLSLAATLCTDEVASTIAGGEVPVLAHGPTFMGNPLACAAALASLDLVEEALATGTVQRIEGELHDALAPAGAVPGVAEVRVLGAIGVVQLRGPVDVPRATAAALDAGVWIRPFRDLIYTMPPYVSSTADVAAIGRGITAAAAACAPGA